MPGASLALFADLGVCHVQKSSVTICVLPTPSGWRATRFKMLGDHAPIIISIHALRVEGDPRPLLLCQWCSLFLSTPSGWRATTGTYSYTLAPTDFYPRPPGGGRPAAGAQIRCGADFYPRPPGGGRLCDLRGFHPLERISIHALRVEGDFRLWTFSRGL